MDELFERHLDDREVCAMVLVIFCRDLCFDTAGPWDGVLGRIRLRYSCMTARQAALSSDPLTFLTCSWRGIE